MLEFIYSLLIILILGLCFVIYKTNYKKGLGTLTTLVTLLVLVFLAHSQSIRNTVTSKLISIIPQLNRIEAETKELKSIVTALNNKIKLAADRPARFSTKRQREQDYQKELHKQDTVLSTYLNK